MERQKRGLSIQLAADRRKKRHAALLNLGDAIPRVHPWVLPDVESATVEPARHNFTVSLRPAVVRAPLIARRLVVHADDADSEDKLVDTVADLRGQPEERRGFLVSVPPAETGKAELRQRGWKLDSTG